MRLQVLGMTVYWFCMSSRLLLWCILNRRRWDLRAGTTPVHRFQAHGGADGSKKEILSAAYSPSTEHLLLTGGGDSVS